MALRHRIHDAAKKGSIDDVARLLKENPELINDKGEDEWTPLFRACYNGRLSMVQFLVENGASLCRGSDEWENSPLHACAINGHRDVAEYLIANNADVNDSENYGSWTPLYAASYFGWPEMIELLLKAGADPSIKSKEGHTALDVVCEAGYRQENRDAIVAMLKNKPVPVGHTWKKNRPTPTRLSVTSVTTPGAPVNYSNPPPYSENRTGSRIYFPWELHNSDYARRALDSLQELLLWLFKTVSDVGVLEEPGCAPNPFKPCLDAYDLLLLAQQRTDALARFLATHPMSPRHPQEAGAAACEIEEGAKIQAVEEGLRARIETVGAAAHRASYGKDDVEGLIKEVAELAKVVGGVDVAEDLQLLLAQFTAHSGSKCARLRFLRATHRLDPSVDEEPAPLGGGNKGTQTPRFDAYGEVCLTGNGSG